MKCISFFIDYYEIALLEILYELYKLKVKGTIEEMIGMLEEMLEDITEILHFPDGETGNAGPAERESALFREGLVCTSSSFEGMDSLLC